MKERPIIGVLALQGAFEEHQKCLECVGCETRQVRKPIDLDGLDAIVLPGGESTAMGLIGTAMSTNDAEEKNTNNNIGTSLWTSLRDFSKVKPVWGTCAGMILLADRCIGTSAVIEDGQALIGGMDVTVCRNYFGSQVSSFEMPVPPPPVSSLVLDETKQSAAINTAAINTTVNNNNMIEQSTALQPYPGVFIRAPAILSAGPHVEVLGRVVAIPCRQAAVTLQELERKINAGEDVIKMGVSDALERGGVIHYKFVVGTTHNTKDDDIISSMSDEKKSSDIATDSRSIITLPGAANKTNAREVISAVRKGNLLCTAFHPELTDDYRWHEYFVNMVKASNSK